MLVNDDNIRFLSTAYRADFNRGWKGVAPLWQRFATSVPSASRKNLYAWMGDWPELQPWIGDRSSRR